MFTNKNQDLHEIDTVKAPNDNVDMIELTDEQSEKVSGGVGFFGNEGLEEGLSRYW
jgi:hypothetical protein